MHYTLTICEGMPPIVESFRFSTHEELEEIPAVRAQVESLRPSAEEVAIFEESKLNHPPLPEGMQSDDPVRLVFVPVEPWLIRAESEFVQLVQAELPPLGVALMAQRRWLMDKPHAVRGTLVYPQIGLMQEPVSWLATIQPNF